MTKKTTETKRPLRVLFCASEVAPFEKTGGLADVAGSLPVALDARGVESSVMMPKYRNVAVTSKKMAPHTEAFFIEHEEYFNRSGLYGNDRGDYPDNLQRFSFFCHEALERAKSRGVRPDIVHAHDWQTALLPVLLKTKYASDPFFERTKTVLSVHNIAYQGHFPKAQYGTLGLDPGLFSVDGFEFYGKINLLKAGLLYADAITTVSPTYAQEIKTDEFGFGLDGVVKERAHALRGILNGIDTSLWNPESDPRLAAKYSGADLSGKARCKEALQKKCGFETDPSVPVFAMVTRLAEQKGLDLLSEVMDRLLEQKAQFVLLGEGDAVYHTTFSNIAKRHAKNAKVFLEFDAQEAHGIYAGADFFLMPSLFEPCGLGQMISMRYGTVPLVRQVGGLADTVRDVKEHPGTGNGLVFRERSPEKLWQTMERALHLYKDVRKMETVRKIGMAEDFSWKVSSGKYLELYEDLMK